MRWVAPAANQRRHRRRIDRPVDDPHRRRRSRAESTRQRRAPTFELLIDLTAESGRFHVADRHADVGAGQGGVRAHRHGGGQSRSGRLIGRVAVSTAATVCGVISRFTVSPAARRARPPDAQAVGLAPPAGAPTCPSLLTVGEVWNGRTTATDKRGRFVADGGPAAYTMNVVRGWPWASRSVVHTDLDRIHPATDRGIEGGDTAPGRSRLVDGYFHVNPARRVRWAERTGRAAPWCTRASPADSLSGRRRSRSGWSGGCRPELPGDHRGYAAGQSQTETKDAALLNPGRLSQQAHLGGAARRSGRAGRPGGHQQGARCDQHRPGQADPGPVSQSFHDKPVDRTESPVGSSWKPVLR